MDIAKKINNLLKEKKFYIEKHFYNIENKFYRIKSIATHTRNWLCDIYLVYDTPMIPNVLHGYQYQTKKEEGLDYLYRTLQQKVKDPIWLFYCNAWYWIDKLIVKE